jgi:hypothetical protein
MEEVKNKETNTGTKTTVEEKKETKGYEGDLQNLMGEGKYHLSAPLFLMFAEYLGYVGKVLKWVDDWCVNGKKPEDYKVKFIEVEAVVAFNECKKKYTEKKMRELYDSLYEVILFMYDDTLKSLENPTED